MKEEDDPLFMEKGGGGGGGGGGCTASFVCQGMFFLLDSQVIRIFRLRIV